MLAEWEHQSMVQLTWPHEGTDWATILDEITAVYEKMAREIRKREPLLIVDSKYYDSIFNYWEDCSMCGFTQDNILYVSDSIYPSSVESLNLRCAISFGPALIINGQPRIYGAYGWGVQPRTCIAQRQDGAVLFLVIDGRQADSYGATLKQAQDILLNYGAYNAFNLDGGASSTMVFDGNVVNKPSDIAGERYVPTAFIVK